jgi:hypothetical protein
MARPKINGATILIRLSPGEKERLSRKLIAAGFVYRRKGEVEAGFTQCMKALSSMPLEFFEKIFEKGVDIPE